MAKVLVVDDDETARRALRRMLANLGHEACIVGGGAEALHLLDSLRFDLVITDVYMGSVDGMELLLRIHQRGLDVPVVAISGGGFIATDEVLAMARECGAAATLDKPFTPQQLRDVVEPLLPQAPGGKPCPS